MDEQSGAKKCFCPYCDAEVEEETVICVMCKTVIVECAKCGKPVRDGADVCPSCGEPPK